MPTAGNPVPPDRSPLDFLIRVEVVALRTAIAILSALVLEIAWGELAAARVGVVQRNVMADLLLAQLRIGRPATVAGWTPKAGLTGLYRDRRSRFTSEAILLGAPTFSVKSDFLGADPR